MASEVPEPFVLTTTVVDSSMTRDRFAISEHSHTDDLLAWAYRGALTVSSANALRRIVPGQGVWIPAGEAHAVALDDGAVAGFTYVRAFSHTPGPAGATTMRMNRAVQEMLLHLDATPMPAALRLRTQQLALDLIGPDSRPTIDVPLPRDVRIQSLARHVMKSPAAKLTLEDLAAEHALSVRTVARTFDREVGMPFSQWRSLARMSHAVALLAEGKSVNLVAHHCGYSTTSAFSSAFRRVTGVSPTQYLNASSVA